MIRLENVLKTCWRRFEDVLKTSWGSLEDVFKTSWRRLEVVWPRWVYWSWSRRLEDVFWRRMNKTNIFVLMKTSWRRLGEFFWRWRRKTSSRHLQDVFIKKNVCWDGTKRTINQVSTEFLDSLNIRFTLIRVSKVFTYDLPFFLTLSIRKITLI